MVSAPLVLARQTLSQPACSAEFCPAGPSDLVAVGTYLLADEETQSKSGCVHLFRVDQQGCAHGQVGPHGAGLPDGEGQADALQGECLQEVSSLPMTAVFDIKWKRAQPESHAGNGSAPILGVAGADSKLSIVQLEARDTAASPSHSLLLTSSESIGGVGVMALSLDWGHASCQDVDSVAVSSSDGGISLLKVTDAAVRSEVSFNAHDLEAWVVVKDRWQPGVLFSGADDCKMKVWDSRMGYEAALRVDRKTHEMGVCCLQPHPLREHILCSGSYDEKVRLWDTRNLRSPTVIAESGTGGGVWRLKWHPAKPQFLLAACMHAGFHVLKVDESFTEVDIAESHTEQESLAYGADWMFAPDLAGGGDRDIVATCSFYDMKFHVWSPSCTAASALHG